MDLFLGIDHAAIYARDLRILVDWYTRAFGGTVVDKQKSKAFIEFAGDARIEIIQASPDNHVELQSGHANGIRHIAFRVGDCDAALRHVEALGTKRTGGFDVPEQRIRNIFLHDPEGNTVQLTGPLPTGDNPK